MKESRRLARAIELLAVVLSPLVAFVVLRIALFAPVGLDSSAHTTYIVDPAAMFARFKAALGPTARMREGARVGDLVPARLAYLAFGAVPGFVVWRYVLALVAVGPTYLLLKRCYGRWAGVLGAVIIYSCPVVILAWGRDYPICSGVSYLTACFAGLGLSFSVGSWRRAGWLAVAGATYGLAVWSLAECALYGGLAMGAYGAVRLWRDRSGLVRDAATVIGSAIAVTGLLAVASELLFGQINYIAVTWQSVRYLTTPAQEALWHSASWRWLPYDTYLLVPFVVVVIFLVTFFSRPRDLPTAQLFVGLATTLQVAAATWLQFGGRVETLELDVYSALLWAGTCVTLAVVVAELTKGVGDKPLAKWLPALVALGVPLLFELDPHVPAFTWFPVGLLIAAAVVGFVVAARLAATRRDPSGAPSRRPALIAWAVGIVTAITGGLLVLTVAPVVAHRHVPNTVLFPYPDFAAALGGNDTSSLDWYRVTASLPNFVGPPAHAGDQILMWFKHAEYDSMLGPVGIYHGYYDAVPGGFPVLTKQGADKIDSRKPAQILLMGTSAEGYPRALRSLRPFGARVVKKGVLSAGSAHLHLWLIDLRHPGAPVPRQRA